MKGKAMDPIKLSGQFYTPETSAAWQVTVTYDDGSQHIERLASDSAMIEFAQNVETDGVVTIEYSRYV